MIANKTVLRTIFNLEIFSHQIIRKKTQKIQNCHWSRSSIRNKNYRPQRDTNSGLRNEKESMLTT